MEVKLTMINCMNCKIEMTKAFLNSGGGVFLLENMKREKFFSRKTSPVSVYVCPSCGRVELMAEKPEIFKDDILKK